MVIDASQPRLKLALHVHLSDADKLVSALEDSAYAKQEVSVLRAEMSDAKQEVLVLRTEISELLFRVNRLAASSESTASSLGSKNTALAAEMESLQVDTLRRDF